MAGKIFCVLAVIDLILLLIVDYLVPKEVSTRVAIMKHGEFHHMTMFVTSSTPTVVFSFFRISIFHQSTVYRRLSEEDL